MSTPLVDSNGNAYNNLTYTKVGTAIASASTIAPVSGITHVTGTTAINTITDPSTNLGLFVGCIQLIPDGAWSTTTSGNIAVAACVVL